MTTGRAGCTREGLCTRRSPDALRIVDELHRRRRAGYIPPAALVNAYLGLAEYDEAFVWLERAYEERSNIVQFLKVHPFFDAVRGDRVSSGC